MESPVILRARLLLPVCGPPIENGAALVLSGRIAAVGSFAAMAADAGAVVDLGDAILMPGLVNAHCHLDYTGMPGFLPPADFPTWIKGLMAQKSEWCYSEFAQSWIAGARMLERTGTTTVADIESIPELLPEAWTATALRVCSFLEITCVRSRRNCGPILEETARKIAELEPPLGFVGLSPHAVYSTVPALLRLAAERCRARNWRVTTHVSESAQEFDMCRRASGSMFEWLKKQRDMTDCGQSTPVQLLAQSGLLGPNFLAVHANYLEPRDIRLLADSGSSVAHCPRSHSYFSHDPFPFAALTKAGVNVCLGTDSLASVHRIYGNKPELNLFAEMGVFAAKTNVAPETIVRMATINGARALGLEGQIGQISPGASADLIAIPYSGPKSGIYDGIVGNWSDVLASMVAGRWVVLPEEALA